MMSVRARRRTLTELGVGVAGGDQPHDLAFDGGQCWPADPRTLTFGPPVTGMDDRVDQRQLGDAATHAYALTLAGWTLPRARSAVVIKPPHPFVITGVGPSTV